MSITAKTAQTCCTAYCLRRHHIKTMRSRCSAAVPGTRWPCFLNMILIFSKQFDQLQKLNCRLHPSPPFVKLYEPGSRSSGSTGILKGNTIRMALQISASLRMFKVSLPSTQTFQCCRCFIFAVMLWRWGGSCFLNRALRLG